MSVLSTRAGSSTPTGGSNKRRRTALPGSPRDADNQETGLMRDGGLPRFVGSGSGIHFVRKVYSILGRSGKLQLVPGEDDQLYDTAASGGQPPDTPGTQARKYFWSDEEVLSSVEADFPGVAFESLIAWTRSYFETWHPAFPFLHGPEVLDILERVAGQGIRNIPETDAAIVRSIISISLADSRQMLRPQELNHGPVPPDLVFHNLDHVAASTSFVLGTPASLKNMQAALCVELFLVSMLKLNMASRLGGSVVRMAYHLGLHRCPRRYPNFSPQEVAMRKRIWWSFYCLERLVCQALGLPLDVQDDDVDVCFPTSEYHQKAAAGSANSTSGMDGNVNSSPQRDPATLLTGGISGPNHQLQLLTLLSKHAKLRGKILELRHKSLHVRQDSIERALNVQSELSAWSNEVHDLLINSQSNDEGSDGQGPQSPGEDRGEFISPIYKTLLLVLQHESIITLNRPLLTRRPMTSASQAALQACISASRAVIEAVDDQQGLRQNLAQGISATSMLLAVWPLLTWSVWMSCFILTYAGLEGVTSVASAQRYAKRTLNILKVLSKRGTSWPESCAQAVEYLIVALEKRKSSSATRPDNGFSSDGTPLHAPVTSTQIGEQARSDDIFGRSHNDMGVPVTPSGTRGSTQRVSQNVFEGAQLTGLMTQHSR